MLERGDIVRRCQEIVQKMPLTFVGSGMSMDAGLPGMTALGAQVVERLRAGGRVPSIVVDRFAERMAGSNFEAASDLPELTEHIERVREAIHGIVVNADLRAYRNLNVAAPRPMRRFLEHFVGTKAVLDVVTSNYDRLIEYDCGLAKIPYYTGFYGGYVGNFDPTSTPHHWPVSSNRFEVRIYKVHGSVDWFKHSDGSVWRRPLLTTPPSGHTADIVIPGRVKFEDADRGVHRTLKQMADDAIKRANAFLALGYGFNDEQLDVRVCERVTQRADVPILVLTRTLTKAVRDRLIGRARNYLMIERASDRESRCWTHHDAGNPTIIADPTLWTLDALLEMLT